MIQCFDKFSQKRRHRYFPFVTSNLDIGCGGSYDIRGKIVGIDKEGTRGNKLGYQDNSFRTVTMFAVIEHINRKDMKELQKEIARVLKKDGQLIITTPARFSHPLLKVLAFFNLISRKEINEHVTYYNKDNILDVFSCFKLIGYKRFDIFNQWFLLKSF